MIGFIAGFVCGLVPLILGFKNQNRKFGILGFVLAIIVGVPFSLFGALPVAGIFSWLILRKPAENKPVESEAVNEDLIGDAVNGSANPSETRISDA